MGNKMTVMSQTSRLCRKDSTISTVTKGLDNVVRLKNQQKLQQLTSTTALATPLFSTKLIL